MHPRAWCEPDDLDDGCDDDLRENLRSTISGDEALLWSARPAPPRVRKIGWVPCLFVFVLTSLSGVCLTAMLGVFEESVAGTVVWVLALCLAPAVLGGFIVLDLAVRSAGWLAASLRLARTVYGVTDQRAIIGRVAADTGELQLFSFLPGMIESTTRFELPDGSGDVYFEGLGGSGGEPVGFLGIQAVRRVDELVRETLIDPFPHW